MTHTGSWELTYGSIKIYFLIVMIAPVVSLGNMAVITVGKWLLQKLVYQNYIHVQ